MIQLFWDDVSGVEESLAHVDEPVAAVCGNLAVHLAALLLVGVPGRGVLRDDHQRGRESLGD